MAGALTAAIAAAFSGSAPATTDPYFDYTTLLLPGTGTNGAQNNTFLDGSTNNFTITRNGNTTQGTFSPFSQTGWGNYFDGSSYLANTSTTSVVAPGTSNFTAEFWVYATTDQQSQSYGSVLHIGSGASGAWMVSLLYSSAGAMKIRVGTTVADYDSTSTISTNRWYHIALVREGTGSNQTKIYVDGSLFYTFTLSDNLSNSSALYIGTTGFNTSARRLSGYVSNVRLTVGTALYTGAFTPSTTPLTTTSQGATATQVELLACQSNRFLDNSSNGWVFTTSGSPTVVAFSPFNPTASWSAATYGGSGYFDGSGDYLSIANNSAFDFGSGDFSIEAWVYVPNVSGGKAIITKDGAARSWIFVLNNADALFAIPASTTSTLTNAVQANTWVHLYFGRSGNTMYKAVNGSVSSGAWTTTIPTTSTAVEIGRQGGYGSPFTGYISGLRVLKGSAAYTSNFTPSAPPTAITNTVLLTNFTNAGVYDATSKNDLETVGNAQISTAQYKFPPSSMAFDGTGSPPDYLPVIPPVSDFYAFGTGDFTFELWLYTTTVSPAYQAVWDARTADPSLGSHFVLNSGKPTWWLNGASRIQGASALSINTWYHIAVARSGTSTKMFVGGTQVGSTYTDSNTYISRTVPRIGASFDTTPVNPFYGYIQDLRVTKGYARYTANFTPPTAAFPTL